MSYSGALTGVIYRSRWKSSKGLMVVAYEITAGDVLEAIQLGAREGTMQALRDLFADGNAKVQLTGDAAADLAAVLQALQGTLHVQGQFALSQAVDVSDRATRTLGEVSVVGQSVPLRGLASERPTASAANKGFVYWAVDTGEVSVSTGTSWRALGVA